MLEQFDPFLETLSDIRRTFTDSDGSDWTPRQLRQYIERLDDNMKSRLLSHFITLEWTRLHPVETDEGLRVDRTAQ